MWIQKRPNEIKVPSVEKIEFKVSFGFNYIQISVLIIIARIEIWHIQIRDF